MMISNESKKREIKDLQRLLLAVGLDEAEGGRQVEGRGLG